MPLYEYECSACGHRFELLQKLSAGLASTCGSCGGRAARLISLSAIQFKGTGWYVTDYARKGTEAQGDGKADAEGEKSAEPAKDMTPEKKLPSSSPSASGD